MTPEESGKFRARFIDEARRFRARDYGGVVPVLKAHLFAEQMLNAVLQANLNMAGSELDHLRLSFSQKVSIVVASERLSDNVKDALISLNGVRNKCAHRFEFELKVQDWEKIFQPFSDQMPYENLVPNDEEQKWMRWAYWLLGLMFPTPDVYENES